MTTAAHLTTEQLEAGLDATRAAHFVHGYVPEKAMWIADQGVQVLGGHGYIREHGMEQLVRDARVCQIYEGANGVQAMDLVGRKLPAHAGRYLRRFFQPVAAFIADNSDNGDLTEFVAPLSEAFALLQKATRWLAENGTRDPNEAGAAASEYLRLFALVAMAFMWARMARIALASESKNKFYRGKLATARFYMQRVLPQTASLYACIVAGGSSIADFEDEAF